MGQASASASSTSAINAANSPITVEAGGNSLAFWAVAGLVALLAILFWKGKK